MKTLIALLLLTSSAMAFDGAPTEIDKTRALKQGYAQKGMQWGSIDMTKFFKSDEPKIVDPAELNEIDVAAVDPSACVRHRKTKHGLRCEK